MLESVSTDSPHYPQERGARFVEGDGRFTAMPRMTLRLRYSPGSFARGAAARGRAAGAVGTVSEGPSWFVSRGRFGCLDIGWRALLARLVILADATNYTDEAGI
jgi:hypothetical protein